MEHYFWLIFLSSVFVWTGKVLQVLSVTSFCKYILLVLNFSEYLKYRIKYLVAIYLYIVLGRETVNVFPIRTLGKFWKVIFSLFSHPVFFLTRQSSSSFIHPFFMRIYSSHCELLQISKKSSKISSNYLSIYLSSYFNMTTPK